MSKSTVKTIAWLALLVPSCLLAAPKEWKVGTYKLQAEPYDSGNLTLLQSKGKSRKFRLDVVQCVDYCGTDAAVNHVGDIENGKLVIHGRSAVYTSSGEDGQADDPDLGICRIDFTQLSAKSLRLTQSGNCWWFGQGVGVSGIYVFESPGQ